MAGLSSLLSMLVVVVAVVLGFLAQQKQSPPPFSASFPCTDTPIILPSIIVGDDDISKASVEPCHVFSDTYAESRTKFRQAAASAGAELHSLPVDVPLKLRMNGLLDFNNDQYTIDIAVLYGTKPGLAVHTSGVHGVEGYAGAPIQIAFLESVYPKLKADQPELPTIVLIHAVNPFGMAHYRRVNENNVDLNRNGLHPEEWQATNTKSFGDPAGPYAAYEEFRPLFNPSGTPSWFYAMVGVFVDMLQGIIKHGFDALKTSLVTGQYYEPKGVFYGGQSIQPSLAKIYHFFEKTLLAATKTTTNIMYEEKDPEETANATPKCCTGAVTWIDVHTGLGPSGVDVLLGDAPTMAMLEGGEGAKWFPNAPLPHHNNDAKAVNKGYHNAKGFTTAFFRRLFQERPLGESYLSTCQEFGTVPGFMVAHSMIVENRAFQHLESRQDALEWAKRTTKRAFYKQTPQWREQILNRGMTLWLQAIQRSSYHSIVSTPEEAGQETAS